MEKIFEYSGYTRGGHVYSTINIKREIIKNKDGKYVHNCRANRKRQKIAHRYDKISGYLGPSNTISDKFTYICDERMSNM